MKSTELEFEEVVKRVSQINQKLKSKGFDVNDIDNFWSKMIGLIPKIKEVGVENIEVCTSCGRLTIEELPETKLSCCYNSNYIKIQHG